jgi:NAD(P)-dependent dehydrogenase (short-subunit alcohol dehydrogenase family)
MKTALITGANKGLGFETAKHLIKNGFFVYLGCRNRQAGLEAAEKLRDQDLSECKFLELDVTSQESIDKAVETMCEKLDSLDVLINNAGILGRIPDNEHPLNVEDVKNVFETNLFGAIRVTQAFLPLLEKSHHGRIVNVTSDVASLTLHHDPNWEYFPFKG